MQDIVCATGALLSLPDIRDYEIVTTAECDFPEEFELTMPSVKSQGSVGSCVAHALATVMEFYNKKQHHEDIDMSVGYIYGNRENSSHKGQGMKVRDALKAITAGGNVPYTDFPFNEEVPEIIEKFEREKSNLESKAYPFRITSYVRTYNEEQIKTALYHGYPVIFTMRWYDDIKLKNGVVVTTQDSFTSSHCMVIYGWDQNGWKIQNSWGILWGNAGRAILPYDIVLFDAYSIIDELVGDIDIKKPFQAKTAFGKWCVKVINQISAFFYRIKYNIKY